MVAVRISVIVGADRRIVIQVPDEIPNGPVDLVIQAAGEASTTGDHPARAAARSQLAAAGLLSSAHYPPPGLRVPTDEEVRATGELPPGARPSEDLINEDRDET